MKCTAAITLALVAAAFANPLPAKGNNKNSNSNNNNAADAANANADDTAQQVTDAINTWLDDIKAVNTFVDTAGQLDNDQDIIDAATTALAAAQDEGVENDALAGLVDLDASGLAANQDLLNQFNIIGPAIQDTVDNPQNLQKNLDAINGARCPGPVGNGAIFEEGEVQQSAAAAAGVQADLPELPQACGDLAQALLDQNANAADANAADANAADANAADANASDANAADANAADANAADANAADASANAATADAKANSGKAAKAAKGN